MATGTPAPPLNRDLIAAARDTLSEPTTYPSGVARPADRMSWTDAKLIKYARRALGEYREKNPPAFYSCPSYNPYIPAADGAFLDASFVLGARYLNSVALEICKLAQIEGTELANPGLAAAQSQAGEEVEGGR